MKEKKHSKDTEQEIENGEPKENDSPVAKRLSYEEKLTYVTAIAKPMAHKKLAKKIYKLIKKGK